MYGIIYSTHKAQLSDRL